MVIIWWNQQKTPGFFFDKVLNIAKKYSLKFWIDQICVATALCNIRKHQKSKLSELKTCKQLLQMASIDSTAHNQRRHRKTHF